MPVIALPALVIAAIALILILGFVALAYLTQRLVPDVPLIGGWIRRAIGSAINAGQSAAYSWCQGVAAAAGFVFQGVALTLWWALYWVVTHATQLATFANNINRSVGYVAATAANDLRLAENQAHLDAVGARNYAVAYATSVLRQAGLDADGAYTRAAAVALADMYTAEGYAKGLYDQGINYTDAVKNELKTDIANAVGPIAAGISGDVTALQTAINQTAAAAVAEVNAAVVQANNTAAMLAQQAAAGVTSAVNAAGADVLNPVLDQLIPALGTIIGSLPASVADVLDPSKLLDTTSVTTLEGTLAVLAPAITAVAAETAECGVPLCANLSGLSGLLGALANDAIWAALVAVTVEVVNHPQAAETDIQQFVAPVVNTTATAFRDLVGV